MATRIIRLGDSAPDLDTFVGSLEFIEQRLHIRTTRPLRFQREHAPLPDTTPHHGVEFMLLDNAFLPDAVCPRFNVYSDWCSGGTVWDLLRALLVDTSPQSIRLYLEEILSRHLSQFYTSKYHRSLQLHGTDGQNVFIKGLLGKNVFSHSLLTRIEPLRTVPADWDMTHLCAALANGQVKKLAAKGKVSALELLELILATDADRIFRSAWTTSYERGTKQVTVARDGARHSTFTLAI